MRPAADLIQDGRLAIGPLENLPVIKDLATDMSRFFERWQQAKGTFAPTKTRDDPVEPIRPDSAMRIAASVTLLSLALGYPLAYYMSFHAGPRKELLYQLVIVPLWVSYLVRGYAWKTILGSEGVLNSFLQYLHITHEPVSFLLYSPFAVVLTLTHIYTPFVFLPLYASLEHIPQNLIEASHDLGASPRATFFRVILPLSMPGLLAGATFAFVLSLGDFLAPLLVGGASGTMIANVVQSLFGAAYDWPLGSAISLCILVIIVSLLFLTERLEKRWSFK